VAGGLEVSGTARTSRAVTELIDRLMSGIAERAGKWSAGRARLLLDHVVASSPPEGLMDPDQFRTHLTEESIAFVEYAGDRREAHVRLVAACHLLVNMLQPAVEANDDEYITTEYEELREGLDDLERLDTSNPSLDNRLRSIFDELIELSMALGIVSTTVPRERQQKV
jgi:hypothetical protein